MHKVGETTPLEGFQGNFGEFDEQYRYTYKTGDYSPEKYMNDKYYGEEEEKPYTVKATVDGNFYNYPYDIAGTSLGNPTLYNLLFAGTEESGNWTKSYWLASHGAYAYSNSNYLSYANFGPGSVDDGYVSRYRNLFGSVGQWSASRCAVRPVVSLRSEVSLSEVGGKGTAGTDIWSSVSVGAGPVTNGKFNNEGETAGKIE